MIPGFANTFEGRRPRYEVWFGKVDVAPGRALWFRYTLFAGAFDEASTWAVLFDGNRTTGGRSYWELDELEEPNTVVVPEGYEAERFFGHRQVFHAPGSPVAHLDESNAIGGSGPVEWDLRWKDSGRRFQYVPDMLADSGLVTSRYDTCLLDLRMSGTVRTEDETWNVEGRPGMVGHIRGSSMTPTRWAWSHCNQFEAEDSAVFEGLTAELGALGWTAPPLSAFVVYIDDQRYAFRTPLSIVTADSDFGRGLWTFEATSGGARISGRAEAPSRDRVARVEYDDTDGSNLWCYNSKLADLTVELDAPDLGGKRILRSDGTAAYEFMTREQPTEEPLV